MLLGDAAHPMVPSQGQGTMVTWEDAADLAALVATRPVPAATKAFARRRRGRCAMVQRYSAAAYMGRPSPARNPRKFLRLLGNFRRIKQMYAGYAPLDALPGEPFEGGAGSGPVSTDQPYPTSLAATGPPRELLPPALRVRPLRLRADVARAA